MMDIGLNAVIEPEVSQQSAKEVVKELKDELEEVETLDMEAETAQVEEAYKNLDDGVDDLSANFADLRDRVDDAMTDGPLGGDYATTPVGKAKESAGEFAGAAQTAAQGGIAKAAGKGGKMATAGAAAGGALLGVTLAGAVGYGILKNVSSIADSSPYFRKTADMFGTAMDLFFRPFGTEIARFLLPFSKYGLKMAKNFNKLYSEKGLAVAIGETAKKAVEDNPGASGGFVAGGLAGAAAGGKVGMMAGGALGGPVGAAIGGGAGAVVGGLGGALGGAVLGDKIENWLSGFDLMEAINPLNWPDALMSIAGDINWPDLGFGGWGNALVTIAGPLGWPSLAFAGWASTLIDIDSTFGWPNLSFDGWSGTLTGVAGGGFSWPDLSFNGWSGVLRGVAGGGFGWPDLSFGGWADALIGVAGTFYWPTLNPLEWPAALKGIAGGFSWPNIPGFGGWGGVINDVTGGFEFPSVPEFPGWEDIVDALTSIGEDEETETGWSGDTGETDSDAQEDYYDENPGQNPANDDGSSGNYTPPSNPSSGHVPHQSPTGTAGGGSGPGSPTSGHAPAPGLARGGMVSGPRQITVGEQEPEVVAPFSDLMSMLGTRSGGSFPPSGPASGAGRAESDSSSLREADVGRIETLLEDVLSAIQGLDGDVYIDGKEAGKAIRSSERKHERRRDVF